MTREENFELFKKTGEFKTGIVPVKKDKRLEDNDNFFYAKIIEGYYYYTFPGDKGWCKWVAVHSDGEEFTLDHWNDVVNIFDYIPFPLPITTEVI